MGNPSEPFLARHLGRLQTNPFPWLVPSFLLSPLCAAVSWSSVSTWADGDPLIYCRWCSCFVELSSSAKTSQPLMTMAVIVCTGFIFDCCFNEIIFVKLQLRLFIVSVEPLDSTIGQNHPVSHHRWQLWHTSSGPCRTSGLAGSCICCKHTHT